MLGDVPHKDRFVEITTVSGRSFRFNISDYLIFSCKSRPEIAQLASQIVSEKYRYCEWDREHPTVNAESEILEALIDRLWNLINTESTPLSPSLAKLLSRATITYK